jgi:hypothetical protein
MRLSWGGFVGATVRWGKDWRGSRVARTNSSIHSNHILGAVIVVLLPIVPLHLVVKAIHSDVKFLHVGAKDLAWSLCRIPESLLPAVKPLLLD